MSRTAPRKPTDIQTQPPPAAEARPAPTAEEAPPRLSAQWKIALAVWFVGFFGLMLVEFVAMASRLFR